jgi:hypothetical protein
MSGANKPPEGSNPMFQFNAPVSGKNQNFGPGGNITDQSITIGNQTPLDVAALTTSLRSLYDQLATLRLPGDQQMDAQTAVNQAKRAIESQNGAPETVVQQVQQISEDFKKAGVKIEQGSQVASTILNIAKTVAPAVGIGAKIIAGWFGLPLL